VYVLERPAAPAVSNVSTSLQRTLFFFISRYTTAAVSVFLNNDKHNNNNDDDDNYCDIITGENHAKNLR